MNTTSTHPSIRRLRHLVLVLLGGALLSGCATGAAPQSTAPLPVVVGPVEVQVAESPTFYADTTDRRTFGLLGVFSMASEGNRLVREHGLEDPSNRVAAQVRAALAKRPRVLATGAEASGLQVQVRTLSWDYRPYRREPGLSYVVYRARITLTDPRSGEVLASDGCLVEPQGQAELLDTGALLENDAAALKQALARAADRCLTNFRSGPLATLIGGGSTVARR